MIICLIGWCLWLCVQVFVACFTPFRLQLLNEHGRYYNKIDVVLRYMSIKARWLQKEYEFYFYIPSPNLCEDCGEPSPRGLHCSACVKEWHNEQIWAAEEAAYQEMRG